VSTAIKLEQTTEQFLEHFEDILKKAVERRASDIHLKSGLPAVVRVNGQLYYLGDDGTDNPPRLSSHTLSGFAKLLMTAPQALRYEEGEEIDCSYEMSGLGRFRINICQQKGNTRIVVRHIPDSIKSIDELGLPSVLRDLCAHKHGLILVTGSTGSGKSTTLAAMIDHIARNRSCHILTIEDPIEFSLKDRKSVVTQREVGLDTKSFSRALKYALRQDPDVILIGEMRDEETIQMALTAAETGHLVLSTLHTNNATETINRILGTVPTGSIDNVRLQLATVLLGVVSQRLIKKANGKGMIAATEILVSNARTKELISDPHRTSELSKVIATSGNLGMQSFDQCLLKLVQSKQISKEEAFNHCTNVQDFQLLYDGVSGGQITPAGGADEKVISRKDRIKEVLSSPRDLDQVIELDIPKKKKE